jgi:hypothetical protein
MFFVPLWPRVAEALAVEQGCSLGRISDTFSLLTTRINILIFSYLYFLFLPYDSSFRFDIQ